MFVHLTNTPALPLRAKSSAPLFLFMIYPVCRFFLNPPPPVSGMYPTYNNHVFGSCRLLGSTCHTSSSNPLCPILPASSSAEFAVSPFFQTRTLDPRLPSAAQVSSSLSPAARSSSRRSSSSSSSSSSAAAAVTGSLSRCRRSGDVDVFKLNLSPYEEYMATRCVSYAGMLCACTTLAPCPVVGSFVGSSTSLPVYERAKRRLVVSAAVT